MSDNNKKGFEQELAQLLNRYSKENESNTADHILASFLVGALRAFNIATNKKTFQQMGIEINKAKKEDFITCESCTKQCTDIESMQCDSESNWFCPECWEELAPVMKREYEEMKRNGEIDND